MISCNLVIECQRSWRKLLPRACSGTLAPSEVLWHFVALESTLALWHPQKRSGTLTPRKVFWHLGIHESVLALWHPQVFWHLGIHESALALRHRPKCSGTLAPTCHTTYRHKHKIRQPVPFFIRSQTPAVFLTWFIDPRFLITV